VVACFGAMYFAALRPEEAVELKDANLTIARNWNKDTESWEYEWGKLYVEKASPHAGSA
jgi:hypothetical protein